MEQERHWIKIENLTRTKLKESLGGDESEFYRNSMRKMESEKYLSIAKDTNQILLKDIFFGVYSVLLQQQLFIHMYFYDPKTRKHYCQIDEDRINIVGWAEKGIVMHLRVVKMGQLRNFWDSITTNYSKLVYDPEKQEAWIQYQGTQGNSCREILKFILGFDLKTPEEYVVVFKRFARTPASFSLPKEAAEYEYETLKGIGLSKAMGGVESKKLLTSQGRQAQECQQYLAELLN